MVVCRTLPVPLLVTVTSALTTSPRLGSVTTPVIDPKVLWAMLTEEKAKLIRISQRTNRLSNISPKNCGGPEMSQIRGAFNPGACLDLEHQAQSEIDFTRRYSSH